MTRLDVPDQGAVCPNGHRLPNYTDTGECSIVMCAERPVEAKPLTTLARSKRARKAADPVANAVIDALVADGSLKDLATNEKTEWMHKLTSLVGRHAARLGYLDVPNGLEGDQAEQWATARIMQLVPYAVAEMEYQLKFGDDKQRKEAAQDLLDRAGFYKGDKGGMGTAPIIILTGGATLTPPWRSTIVDAQVVDDEKK